jgi:hypothetical protein
VVTANEDLTRAVEACLMYRTAVKAGISPGDAFLIVYHDTMTDPGRVAPDLLDAKEVIRGLVRILTTHLFLESEIIRRYVETTGDADVTGLLRGIAEAAGDP